MSDFKVKCTKFDFRWGSAPDPAEGAYSAAPDPIVVFKGLLLREKRGRGRKEREGAGRGKERERGERPYGPPVANSWLRHCLA